MAAGDVKAGLQSIAAGSFLTIQPSSGEEWIVVNIYVPNSTPSELYWTDGTNSILIDSQGTGGWFGYSFHVTNSLYLKVKNTHTSAVYMGYSGIQTK